VIAQRFFSGTLSGHGGESGQSDSLGASLCCQTQEFCAAAAGLTFLSLSACLSFRGMSVSRDDILRGRESN
jgi:hypothetical protein